MGRSLRSSANDFRMACGELFSYAYTLDPGYWLIVATARMLDCAQPFSEENRTEGKHLRSQICEADQSTLSAAGRVFVQPAHFRQRRTHDSLRTKTLNAPRIAGSCCGCDIRGTHARGGRSQQPAAAYAGRVRSRPLGGVHGCQPGPLFRFALGRLLALLRER